MEQHFRGPIGRVHRAFLAAANRFTTADTPARRWISPAYANLLWALSGGRGVPGDINGDPYRLDPRFRWRTWPDHEATLAGYLRDRLRPGDHCVDVGANIGLYVLQMARWTAPLGHVTAFEPNRDTMRVLRRHVRINGIRDRVTLVPSAVGRAPGQARLFDTTAGSGLSRLGAANPAIVRPDPDSREVPVVALDDYFAGLRPPDWIIIDVEGYEFEVLAGAAAIIRAGARVIVEVHPHLWPAGTTANDARRLVSELRRTLVPIDGQPDPWTAHGPVSLEPVSSQESI